MNFNGALDVALLSDTGLVRAHNEDSTGADLDHGLLLVADGMGGYRAGEVASAIAVTATVRSYRSGLKGLVDVIDNDRRPEEAHLSTAACVFRDALENANTLIFETARDEPEFKGMGTTVVGLVFHEDLVAVGHVGDSRAYRLRADEFSQITNDHTVRQELIDRGLYTPEEASEAISRNLVTRALGIEKDVRVDVSEEKAIAGDIYILCSDGLNDMVAPDDLEALVKNGSDDLDTLARTLVDQANRNGGEDNVSVLLVRVAERVEPRGWSDRLFSWLRS